MLHSESNLDSELQGDMNYCDPLVHIIFLRIELWWAGELVHNLWSPAPVWGPDLITISCLMCPCPAPAATPALWDGLGGSSLSLIKVTQPEHSCSYQGTEIILKYKILTETSPAASGVLGLFSPSLILPKSSIPLWRGKNGNDPAHHTLVSGRASAWGKHWIHCA